MFETSNFVKIFENKYNATLITKLNIFLIDLESRGSETNYKFLKM